MKRCKNTNCTRGSNLPVFYVIPYQVISFFLFWFYFSLKYIYTHPAFLTESRNNIKDIIRDVNDIQHANDVQEFKSRADDTFQLSHLICGWIRRGFLFPSFSDWIYYDPVIEWQSTASGGNIRTHTHTHPAIGPHTSPFASFYTLKNIRLLFLSYVFERNRCCDNDINDDNSTDK